MDLRGDWPKTFKDDGFDAATPSAWLAESLLMYLRADAREQLFTGIDMLASWGSRAAIEKMTPQDPGAFEAARALE